MSEFEYPKGCERKQRDLSGEGTIPPACRATNLGAEQRFGLECDHCPLVVSVAVAKAMADVLDPSFLE